jgi:signal transduction histidine kinase
VFAVSDRVRAIGDMLSALPASRIEIATNRPEETYWTNADPNQFDTALVNKAVNACDAMNGEGRLTIAVAPVEVMPVMRSYAAVIKVRTRTFSLLPCM